METVGGPPGLPANLAIGFKVGAHVGSPAYYRAQRAGEGVSSTPESVVGTFCLGEIQVSPSISSSVDSQGQAGSILVETKWTLPVQL
jgi:hypothetical protein